MFLVVWAFAYLIVGYLVLALGGVFRQGQAYEPADYLLALVVGFVVVAVFNRVVAALRSGPPAAT